jgi:multidrug resistance efflux pump
MTAHEPMTRMRVAQRIYEAEKPPNVMLWGQLIWSNPAKYESTLQQADAAIAAMRPDADALRKALEALDALVKALDNQVQATRRGASSKSIMWYRSETRAARREVERLARLGEGEHDE